MDSKPGSRRARLMLATLAGSLALGATMATIARAGSPSDDAATAQAFGAATISLAEAIRTAEAAGQGQVVGAEFEIKDGTPVYDVTTQTGTSEIDHRIDPATGAILASTPDAEKADGDDEDDEAQELTALQGAKVSLLQAVATAEAQGGKALAAEYDRDDAALAIKVETVDAAGTTADLRVDAMTGAVIAAADDGEDDDGDHDGGDDGKDGDEQEG